MPRWGVSTMHARSSPDCAQSPLRSCHPICPFGIPRIANSYCRACAWRWARRAEVTNRKSAFPAKAGIHLSGDGAVEGWVPAFAGNADFFGIRRIRASAVLVDRVDPANFFGFFDRLDIEVDDDGLVVAAHKHAFQGLIGRGVDFLVRHIGRDEDEIAGIGLGDIFEVLAPAHPRPAFDHVDDAFERAVMVRAGFGVGVDVDRAGPDLLRPDPGEIDRRGAVHAGGLRCVGVELVAGGDLDALGLPLDPLRLMSLAHRDCLDMSVLLIWVIRDRIPSNSPLAGLVPAIHVLKPLRTAEKKTWMPGTR